MEVQGLLPQHGLAGMLHINYADSHANAFLDAIGVLGRTRRGPIIICITQIIRVHKQEGSQHTPAFVSPGAPSAT